MAEGYKPKSLSFRPREEDLKSITAIRNKLTETNDKRNTAVIRFALNFTEMNFQPVIIDVEKR